MIENEIGESIKKYRKKAGFKQKTAADKLNICRTTYSKYETGEIIPSLDTLFKISEMLDTSIYNLIPPLNSYNNYYVDTFISKFDYLNEQEKSYILKLMNIMIDAHR